jgi:hypothetical protein
MPDADVVQNSLQGLSLEVKLEPPGHTTPLLFPSLIKIAIYLEGPRFLSPSDTREREAYGVAYCYGSPNEYGSTATGV